MSYMKQTIDLEKQQLIKEVERLKNVTTYSVCTSLLDNALLTVNF